MISFSFERTTNIVWEKKVFPLICLFAQRTSALFQHCQRNTKLPHIKQGKCYTFLAIRFLFIRLVDRVECFPFLMLFFLSPFISHAFLSLLCFLSLSLSALWHRCLLFPLYLLQTSHNSGSIQRKIGSSEQEHQGKKTGTPIDTMNENG